MKIFKFDKFNEIDPYGEDDWDDNYIPDWNKIKIIHPTDNDIGKKVLIIKGTRYYGSNPANPKDIIGKILRISININEDDVPIFVEWVDGKCNHYHYTDLTLI